MKKINILLICLILASCGPKLPEIAPDVVTEPTRHDTDDPAIWINRENPEESIVFGTDKNTDGAIYAFDLDGKIIESKTLRNLKRPNNVDVEYDVKLADGSVTDIMIFTERELEQIRIFSVPELKPLDNGGFKVFQDTRENEMSLPMGISIYRSPKSEKTYAIVGRKNGPKEGYLHQIELVPSENGFAPKVVREFGLFSGKKEIEAIAVDDELGFIYCADEGHGIRKYYAEPDMGNEELALFGGEYFKDDIEGIAISVYPDGKGQIIVSDQQQGTFNFFSREDNSFEYALNLGTTETDGCEVTTVALGDKFPNGLFVSMNDNDEKNFFYHDLSRLKEPVKTEK
ncbi:phytase [Zunongwangia endophytica]|uniref:Phytase n=1 Tax=Zunongwangia endophytica TaxID=1808945 RepID=A0ABV8H812_9FLAO|nr:phytase [Zunongwangia endophytica]MDN3595617.1 phytase [Zunongwangia endophytica]